MKSPVARLLAASALLPAFALAAPAQADDAATLTGEIIVTAQKRDQKISDVPVTITAWTGETLQRIGVSQFNELSAFVPGLNIQEQSANNPGFVIRGITSDSGSAQEAARVTVYYNGVDVSRSRGSYFDLFDISRVEVVKGPQATLFGTAAAIGAVSVIPNPVAEGLSGEVRGAIGNHGQRQLSGVLNAGTDTYGVRAAFAWKQRDGVVENIAGRGASSNAALPQRDLNGQEQMGARLSLMLKPLEDLRLDLVYSYDGQRSPGTAFKSGTLCPFGGDTSPFSFAELSGSPVSEAVFGKDELGLWRDVHDINLTARFTPEGSRWSTVHITGYREFDSLEVFDADGSGAWFLEFAEEAIGRQYSHESRVNFDGDGVRAFAGFNWFSERGSQSVPFSTEEGTYLQCVLGIVPGIPCVNADGVVTAAGVTSLLTGGAIAQIPYQSSFRNTGEISSFSLFADVTVDVGQWLELTAGGRMLWEDRTSFYISNQPASVLGGVPLLPFAGTGGQSFRADASNKAFLPRFNALARLADGVNAYATVSKGRRSPVVQLGARNTADGPVPNRTDVPAETVWNYEAGLKGARGPLQASLGVYLQTYDNFQVTVNEGGQLVSRNAGSARNIGVEAEASWRPVREVLLFGNLGWIDAKIRDRPENGIFANNRFRLQPEWQAAAGIDARVGVGGGLELFATPTITHRSRIFFEVPNDPAIAQGPVTLVNLRAGIGAEDGRWQLTGFASNLFDKDHIIDAGNTGGAFGIPTFIRGMPRLLGVEAAIRF
ncbi:TonB-dependent receptor [Sandaracinobacteroides sp. A072]|uniref:TonB-dependent receptor n=1 Tax=Sandaracinobacteroides sp. A072 TaxID=3461146 RepID=UPI0040432270